MADGFFNFNQYNPFIEGLTGDELKAFKNQQMFDTGIGLLQGYQGSLYKGLTPIQKLLNTAIGGYTANRASIGTLGGLLKNKYDIQETKLDIAKKGVDAVEAQKRLRAATDLAYRSRDPYIKAMLDIAPEKAVEKIYSSMYPTAPRLDTSTFLAAKSMGVDAANLDPQSARKLYGIEQGLTPSELFTQNKEMADFFARNPNVPQPQGVGRTKTQLLNDALGNQQTPDYTYDGIRYMPEVDVSIPDTKNILSGKIDERYYAPDGFVGKLKEKPISGNGQQNYTQQYQQNQARLKDAQDRFALINNQIESNYGLVPTNVKLSSEDLNKLAAERPSNTARMTRQLDEVNETMILIDRLKNHKGFNELFSAGGIVAKNMSKDAKDAGALWARIKSGKTLGSLVQLKQEDPNGATPFGQMNYSELKLALDSVTEVPDYGNNPEFALTGLNEMTDRLGKARGYMLQKHQAVYGDFGKENFADTYTGGYTRQDGSVVRLGSVWKGATDGVNLDDNVFYAQMPDGTFRPIMVDRNGTKVPLRLEQYLKRGK